MPLVVFALSKQEDAQAKDDNDECNEDCETFCQSDLMSFAWQIARGMVRKTVLLYSATILTGVTQTKLTNHKAERKQYRFQHLFQPMKCREQSNEISKEKRVGIYCFRFVL